MKKIVAILLCALVLPILTACNSAPQNGATDTTMPETATAYTATAYPVTEQTTSVPEESTAEAVFPQTVLFSYENVKITVTGYEKGSTNAAYLYVDIENPDGLGISVSELYVNRIALSAGNASIHKEPGYISIVLNSFDAMGVDFDGLGLYELRLAVKDQSGDLHKGELVSVEIPDADCREPADPGTLLFDENGVSLYAKLKTDDSFWGSCVYFYCVNHSGKTVRIGAASQPTYNGGSSGVEAGSVLSGDIPDGRASAFVTNLFDDQLEAAGIYPVTSVCWTLNVYDAEAESLWFSPGAVTVTGE